MLFLAIVTRAQVPGTISFQGSLTEPGTNSPVADGDYNVVFTLFDALSAGSSVWTETHSTLSIADGTFNVLLGKNTPLDPAEFNKPLFLEISVGGETLTPRIELASSAFSQSAKSLAGAGNKVPSSGNVYIGGDLQVGPVGGSPAIDLAIDDNDTGLEVTQEGQLSFYYNGIEGVTLNPSGNLGIGTNAPSQLLDIANVGTDNFLRIQAGGTDDLLSGILFNKSNLDYGYALRFSALNEKFSIDFQSDETTYNSIMSFNPIGNVGINSASFGSQYKLYINSDASETNIGNYPLYINNAYSGSSSKVGVWANLTADGTGGRWAHYATISNSGSTSSYGYYLSQSGTTTGIKYGAYFTGEDRNYMSGSLGLGTSNPGTNKLYANGNIYVNGIAYNPSSTLWTVSSDKRFKKDITTLSDGLSVINRLRPVSFYWNDLYKSKHEVVKDHIQYNFIAQEFEKVFPNSVSKDDDGYLQVDLHNLTPFLVKAVQEQQNLIEELNNKIDELENQNSVLTQQNKVFEVKIDQLSDSIDKLEKRMMKNSLMNTSFSSK